MFENTNVRQYKCSTIQVFENTNVRNVYPIKKDDPDPLVASSVRVFCAHNSQREGRSLPWEGRDHLFLWDVGISVGFSTETTGSLRNPETRRTPSCIVCSITASGPRIFLCSAVGTKSIILNRNDFLAKGYVEAQDQRSYIWYAPPPVFLLFSEVRL